MELMLIILFSTVLFNLYGPRAALDDTERIEFKMKFFKILQVLSSPLSLLLEIMHDVA